MADYLEHQTKPGERWDTIAQRYYGDARLVHHILRANPEFISGDTPPPLVFDSAVTIRVPVRAQDVIDATQLPAWKR